MSELGNPPAPKGDEATGRLPGGHADPELISASLWPMFEELERRMNDGASRNVLSGFAELDAATDGFAPGDLVVVGGATSMGKTSFALQVATHVGSIQKRPVAYFALQESRETLVRRVIASDARISGHGLRRGLLDDASLARLATAAGYLATAPIYIQENLWDLVPILEAMKRSRDEHGVELFVVDPIQMVSVPALHGLPRDQEVGHVARELKRFALRERVPVIACSSLSRQPDTRYDRRPTMTDVRDSGDIENSADHLLLLYRPEYYFGPVDKEGNDLEGRVDLILNKQRTGYTGQIPLVWYRDFTRFGSLHT